jgi:lipopolysaccharide/colanic/teichoic acid biosynthesis glycosyltransferase
MSRADVAIPTLVPPAPPTSGMAFLNAPSPEAASQLRPPAVRTIWGLDPVQLHTRYWASNGVQVVRQGEPSEIVKHAELFLLTESRTLTLFRLGDVIDALNWIKPQVLFLRLHDSREHGYREHVVTDEFDQFVRFERIYDASGRLTRVVLTPDRDIAKLWQSAPNPLSGWRRLRRFIPRTDRATVSIGGSVYDRGIEREVAFFVHDLIARWRRPDSTVLRAMPVQGQVWRDAQSKIDPSVKFIGPVWVGCGRTVEASNVPIIGPAVIWDDPTNRPVNDEIHWLHIEPRPAPNDAPRPRRGSLLNRAFKRAFDICFATLAILMTLPMYPFIMIAIWLEDGPPFFFAHKRETCGGREFPCVKFRSMRKDAEKMKAILKKRNQADGPQFYIENDPRLTNVGRFLRKYNLDELPQFWNVLTGDMSIVGPRPSPHKENQYCPPWREARLSVRPGITGLWQVKRTRRAGSDFQEWIKYDLEYVERRSWWLDMKIIWKTIESMLGKMSRSD